MTKNRTEISLMARGIDSARARQLRIEGWTLSKLKTADQPTLISLGIATNAIKLLARGSRPSIPINDLTQVLFANRWLCCICRDPARPILLHHIRNWAHSKDHSPTNLAVLCAQHHGEAHTTRQLEMTLSADRIVEAKKSWEREVNKMDRRAIQKATQPYGDYWWYFNHLRLFEMARANGVILPKVPGFQAALVAKVCDSEGTVTKVARPGSYMYADSDGRQLYRYVQGVLDKVVAHSTIRNISNDLDRGVLNNLIVSGDLIFVQGLHTFSVAQSQPPGKNLSYCKRSANKVEISFILDMSEATSSSAWSLWLRGKKCVGSLVQVRSLTRLSEKLHIEGTVLAICAEVDGLKERMYEVSLYESGLPLRKEMVDENIDDFFDFE